MRIDCWTCFVKSLVLALAWGLLARCSYADDRTDRPQVSAATSEAISSMRAQIEDVPLSRNLTVGDFLRRVGAEKDLDDGLARAELVGGPRWIDNDTCQVQLQMSGARVAQILEHIAADHEPDSPISVRELSRLTINWDRRTFTGSGSSTAFAGAEKVRPHGTGSAWDTVSDADRKKALASAKDDAIKHVLDSIQPILLAGGKTVGDAMSNHAKVRQAVSDWLDVRPVLRVEYRRDMQVELTMAGTPDGMFDVVRRAVGEEADIQIPRHEVGWMTVRNDFEKNMALPIGHATVSPNTAPAAPAPPAQEAQLPRRVPAWVSDHFEVDAVAEATPDTQLRAARAAEAGARARILERINQLPYGRGSTLGEMARHDPRIRSAIADAMDHAQIIKTDYSQKKKVTVTLRLELQDLWDALHSSQ